MSSDKLVGYKKPPVHGQFKPGQSGNPNGRPKGTKNFKTDLLEELAERIAIKEDGEAKKVSKQRAMLKALMAKSITGDTKASAILFGMILKILHEEQADAEPMELTATDHEILEQFAASILSDAKSKKTGKKHA